MTYEVTILSERRRGCGYRTSSADGIGIYLVGPLFGEPCERLPFGLTPCPECAKRGLKCQMTFSRASTWIEPAKLFGPGFEPICDPDKTRRLDSAVKILTNLHNHKRCPMCSPPEKGLLIWIGRGHYSTASFNKEAAEMGVSRKLTAIPRGFGPEHWIYLAHSEAVIQFGSRPSAGVFRVFKPTHIDLVIDDENNIPEKAKNLKDKFGEFARLVKVIPEPEPEQLRLDGGQDG